MKIRLFSQADLPEDLKQADPAGSAKYVVTLTSEEREALHDLTYRGRIAARTLKCAQVLLKADEGEAGPAHLCGRRAGSSGLAPSATNPPAEQNGRSQRSASRRADL